MIEVTERVLSFAQQQFMTVMRLFLDDPSQFERFARGHDASQLLASYRRLADDLGLDYDEILDSGPHHGRQKLRVMETGNVGLGMIPPKAMAELRQ